MSLLLKIFWVFTKVSLLSWGGGPASLALMQSESVQAGFISREEFADAVALGNALPGPIAPQVACYIGFKQAGAWGGFMGAMGAVAPTTILMFAMIVAFFAIKDAPWIKSMLQAVRPAVIGLLLWTAYDMSNSVLRTKGMSWTAAIGARWDKFLIALAVFIIVTYFNLNPAIVILIAAVFGLFVYR